HTEPPARPTSAQRGEGKIIVTRTCRSTQRIHGWRRVGCRQAQAGEPPLGGAVFKCINLTDGEGGSAWRRERENQEREQEVGAVGFHEAVIDIGSYSAVAASASEWSRRSTENSTRW